MGNTVVTNSVEPVLRRRDPGLTFHLFVTHPAICLEHISMVPKIFEPLKFDCIQN